MVPSGSFGPFHLDRQRGVLLRDGQPVPLGQRALSVLTVLAESPGRPVSKAELMARVWPGTFVEEGNLTVQIAVLRKALGETADGQSWILTVPRVGYRLLGGGATPLEHVAESSDIPRLAVLPFRVLGGSPDQAYFAEGLIEDLILALSRFRSFGVLSRPMSPKEGDARQAASELGVRYILEGSVRRTGDRLRLIASLVDVGGNAPLWAEQFDGSLDDVFEFQDRITESVATLIVPRIQTAEIQRSRRERPGSFAAYDIYLRALSKIISATEPDNAEAYELLSHAIAMEPNNPLLLSHAAWVVQFRLAMGWRPFGSDDRQLCGELARRGLEHANGDAMIMSHCGMALLEGAREYDLGMAAVKAAVEANPNNLSAVVCAGIAHLLCSDLDEAIRQFHRATRVGPGDPGAHFALCGLAHVHLIRGEYAESVSWAMRAFATNPNFDPTLWMLIAAHAHLGRMEEAHRFVQRLLQRRPGATVASIRSGQADKDPSRIAAVLEGLRLAGLPET